MNIFIPVLFICAGLQCEFQQATTYFSRIEECVAAVETQYNFIVNAGQLRGLDIKVRATCVAVTVTTI
jgi:hypothetical protein